MCTPVRAGPSARVGAVGAQAGGLTLTLDGRTMADMIADGPDDDRHLRTIAAHTSAYITHVRRQLKHTLPKAVVHCLVRRPWGAPPCFRQKKRRRAVSSADPTCRSLHAAESEIDPVFDPE